MTAPGIDPRDSLEILQAVAQSAGQADFMPHARAVLLRQPGVASLNLVVAEGGRWRVVDSSSPEFDKPLPVSLLARVGEVALLSTALPRFIDELRAQGFSEEAGQVERAVAAALGSAPAPAAAPTLSAARYAPLPSECPQCAGPVRPDEVEWIDDRSAVCGYCGSTLHGT